MLGRGWRSSRMLLDPEGIEKRTILAGQRAKLSFMGVRVFRAMPHHRPGNVQVSPFLERALTPATGAEIGEKLSGPQCPLGRPAACLINPPCPYEKNLLGFRWGSAAIGSEWRRRHTPVASPWHPGTKNRLHRASAPAKNGPWPKG